MLKLRWIAPRKLLELPFVQLLIGWEDLLPSVV